jgi:predicted DNA-binding protein
MAIKKRKAAPSPGLEYLAIRLKPETRASLRAEAEKDGRSESGMIRIILERHVQGGAEAR